MCANQSRLDNQAYEVRVAMQRFGGRDNIRYFPEFPGDRENLIEMLRLFEAHLPVALASVQRQLAELLKSAPHSPADGYLAAPDREDVPLPGFLPLWDDEAGEEYALPADEAEEPLYLPAPKHQRAKAAKQKPALPPKPTRKALPSPKRQEQPRVDASLREKESKKLPPSDKILGLPPGRRD
jgi:hypothetical protein